MKLSELKVGDRVKGVSDSGQPFTGEVDSVGDGRVYLTVLTHPSGNKWDNGGWTCLVFNNRVMSDYTSGGTPLQFLNKSNNLTLTNMLEQYTLLFKSEPEKSFRKAGITDGDDFLTDDGVKVFLSYLLKEHGEQFKIDVVDKLLKESKKKK